MITRSLVYNRAGSNKFWRIIVDGADHRLQWGRVGTVGQALVKTYPTEAAAASEAERVIASKLAKGYVDVDVDVDTHDAPAPQPGPERRELYPMLAEDAVDPNAGAAALQVRLLQVVEDPAFALEPKLDGHRIMAHVDDGCAVDVVGRDGQASQHLPRFRTGRIAGELARIRGYVVLDGELMGGVYCVFDLPVGDGITPESPYIERRAALVKLFDAWRPSEAAVRLVPNAVGHEAKGELALSVYRARGEGLVAKKLTSSYLSGGRSRHVLKLKFVKEADVIVAALGREGKTNAVMEVWRDGRRVEVGTVNMNGKDRHGVAVDDVITVRYLYLGPGDKLVQPRLVRRRCDKAAAECGFDQLERTNKDVMA